MLKFITTTAVAAMIGLTSLAAMPATAQAGNSIYLGFGNGGAGAAFGFRFDDRGHRYREHRPRYHRDRGCSPREAVRKASRMGVRDAHVTRVGKRTISVRGKTYGWRNAKLVFARAPHCPLIR